MSDCYIIESDNKMDNPDRFQDDWTALSTLDDCIHDVKVILMRLMAVRDDWNNEHEWRCKAHNMHEAHCVETNMRQNLYDLDQYLRHTP